MNMNLDLAKKLIKAAIKQAEEMNLLCSVAVVVQFRHLRGLPDALSAFAVDYCHSRGGLSARDAGFFVRDIHNLPRGGGGLGVRR